MKRILGIVVMLATVYMVCADGMINHFVLIKAYQYAFNFTAIFILIPLGIHMTFGQEEKS